VLDWLVKKGCLQPRRSRVVEWPSGKPMRSIVFFDPFGG